ncbi:MAG: hypothetical protein LBI65_03775, partial [Candidatus Symbiothrix sp.]|nr:hypothetical protein [Candidatus Symbiothrix sp.]
EATYKINNNGVWETKTATMNVPVMNAACCPAKISTAPETWLTFACNNLGARDIVSYTYTGTNNYTVNGNSGSDEALLRDYHGDWYRFGGPTPTMLNTPAHDTNKTWDNTYYQNDYLNWLPANNPCPAGWRVPMTEEWNTVMNLTESGNTVNPAYNDYEFFGVWANNNNLSSVMRIGDYLYLPAAAWRYLQGGSTNGKLLGRGGQGVYWCDSKSGYYFNVASPAPSMDDYYTYRQAGFSVRCVVAE